MNKAYFSSRTIKRTALVLSVATATLLLVMGVQAQWSEPDCDPPGCNVDAPINVGGDTQIKEGALGSTSSMTSPVFYDDDNDTFLGDFASYSRLNQARLNYLSLGTGINTNYRIYATGRPYGIRAQGSTMGGYFRDTGGTSYTYVAYAGYGVRGYGDTMGGRFEDSNSSARVYLAYGGYDVLANGTGRIDATSQMRAPIYRDRDDPNFYVDPNSTSRLNCIDLGGETRCDWPDLSGTITGSGSAGQVTFWTGSSSVGGSNSLYWDNSNNRLGIGTTSPSYRLQVAGSTRINSYLGVGVNPSSTYRIYASGASYGIRADGSTAGGYFRDSGGTSYTYVAYGRYGVQGYGATAGGYFYDTDGTSRVYLARGGYDVLADGSGRIDATSQMRAPIYYDRNDPNFYVNPNGTSKLESLLVEDGDGPSVPVFRGSGDDWQYSGYILARNKDSQKWGITYRVDMTDDLLWWYYNGSGYSNNMRLTNSNGDLYIKGSYHCNGVDLAEKTLSEEPLEAAEVASLSSENEGQLRKSKTAYETEVAGVVSTDPGMVLGVDIDENGDEVDTVEIDGVDLALAGRVPVKTTTENGAIKVGDLLVSSSKPGYAMRGDPDVVKNKPGVVIGKAMQSLEDGEAEMLVLILMR